MRTSVRPFLVVEVFVDGGSLSVSRHKSMALAEAKVARQEKKDMEIFGERGRYEIRGPDHKPLPAHVTTTGEAVEMWRVCVWCNQREQDIKSRACSAPDGDGHLFRLAPHVPDSREDT